MKIGVWLNEKYSSAVEGGGASYNDVLINAIDNYIFRDVEVVFISYGKKRPKFKKNVVRVSYNLYIFTKILTKLINFLPKNLAGKLIQPSESVLSNHLKRKGVKVLFYPTQAEGLLQNFPFVTNNWDIGHRETFAFPELIHDGSFEVRDEWYSRVMHKALMVFCESEAGKNELTKYTGISSEKIKVVPTFAGRAILEKIEEQEQCRILEKFGLKKNEYFFYPAQFWAHKNHHGLISAFNIFFKKHNNFKLVLTGSDKGCLNYIRKYTEELGLQRNVVFGGFVSIAELSTFYRNATSLVMPTFFGPTNMPLLEALSLNCPVLCSDIEGHREIMSDAALYFNPKNHLEISKCMEMIVDLKEQESLRYNAGNVLTQTKFKIENSIIRIDEYFKELVPIRNCWE